MKIRTLIAVSAALTLLPAAQAVAQELTDAEIAHIAVTANQIDITAAEQALEKTSHTEVRRFAETMIRDHEGVIAQAVALAERLGVTPADNETSRALLAQAEEDRARLHRLDGDAFDRAYIEHEIGYHGTVITAVREALLPNTTNAELEDLLRGVVPALEAHLEHARRVRAELGLGDAEIAHVAVTANRVDIMAAEQALERSSNPKVRSFAETMIRDHEGVIAQAAALTERLGVVPADNETSRALVAQAEEVRARLARLRGDAFDRAYMEQEVAYHEAVIAAVRQTLVPSATNAELRALLEAVLPALEAHREHAQRVSEELDDR